MFDVTVKCVCKLSCKVFWLVLYNQPVNVVEYLLVVLLMTASVICKVFLFCYFCSVECLSFVNVKLFYSFR